MKRFEDYLVDAQISTFKKNRKYSCKATKREFNKRYRNALVDGLIIILLITDILLFCMFLKKKIEEKKEAPVQIEDMYPIKAVQTSFDVPCPEETPADFYSSYAEKNTNNCNHATFKVTYYCGCSKCCGTYSGGSESVAYGAAGRALESFVSVAVDPGVISLGTVLYDVHGNTYRADDTGGAIKGNRIDVFVGDHEEALKLGIKEMELWW
nr:MAG TPA: lytic transglycosylase [Caudoviricetes sp.]